MYEIIPINAPYYMISEKKWQLVRVERRCDCELPRQSRRLGRACVDFFDSGPALVLFGTPVVVVTYATIIISGINFLIIQ